MSGRKCPAIGQAVVEDDLLPICIAQPFGDLTAENRLEQLCRRAGLPGSAVAVGHHGGNAGSNRHWCRAPHDSGASPQAKAEAPSPLQRASQSPGNCPSVAVGRHCPSERRHAASTVWHRSERRQRDRRRLPIAGSSVACRPDTFDREQQRRAQHDRCQHQSSVPRRLQALRTASFRMERRVFTRISPTCPWCRGKSLRGRRYGRNGRPDDGRG